MRLDGKVKTLPRSSEAWKAKIAGARVLLSSTSHYPVQGSRLEKEEVWASTRWDSKDAGSESKKSESVKLKQWIDR